ncbi:MAG TPA: TadE/TadG family type IV pilus assembly protein [Candidatus Micrarchaeia archaeon]|nr:TadE/TadG family type IV pilus assembly protein [Candidatus Micrarchaeia archaeon]
MRMARRPRQRALAGQAFVELALVAPLVALLVVGMVAVVQLTRTQVALDAAAEAAALVAARAPDATAACADGHRQLAQVVEASRPLAGVRFRDGLAGGCVGSVPDASALALSRTGGADAIWFGRRPGRAFCRIGGAGPGTGGADPGDVRVVLAVQPRLGWLPGGGAWLPLRLTADAVAKIDAFRSRDVAVTTEGDAC